MVESSNVNATAKVLSVLEALGSTKRFAELATATELPKSTVHRILQDLVRADFAAVDDSGGYLPGPRLTALSGRIVGRLDALAGADPALERLREATGATVHLAVLGGDEAIYVRKLEASKPYRMASRIGAAIPLHCTSIGKAILAAMPEEQAVQIVRRTGQPTRTAHTLASIDALLADLEVTRTRGWSLDDEENELGVVCVGAAVSDASGRITAGVSISQLRDDPAAVAAEAAGPLVARAAREVSSMLGSR